MTPTGHDEGEHVIVKVRPLPRLHIILLTMLCVLVTVQFVLGCAAVCLGVMGKLPHLSVPFPVWLLLALLIALHAPFSIGAILFVFVLLVVEASRVQRVMHDRRKSFLVATDQSWLRKSRERVLIDAIMFIRCRRAKKHELWRVVAVISAHEVELCKTPVQRIAERAARRIAETIKKPIIT